MQGIQILVTLARRLVRDDARPGASIGAVAKFTARHTDGCVTLQRRSTIPALHQDGQWP